MNFRVWIQAARPKTLFACICPIFMGSCMALSHGSFSFLTFCFTLLTALAIQIGTNLTNDYFDFIKGADTLERKGFERVCQAKLISTQAIKKAIFFSFTLSAVTGCYLIYTGGLIFALLLGISIFFGFIYTAGPYPLAYLGLGELFVFLFFGPIAVMGTYFLQTGKWAHPCLVAGMAPGMLSCAILAMNNLRDVEEDRKAGKKTLAVRFGALFAKMEYSLLLIGPMILPFLIQHRHPLAPLASLSLIPASCLIWEVFHVVDPREYNRLFVQTAKLLVIYSLTFSIGWMMR